MFSREQVLNYVENLTGASYDYPFGDFFSAVLRHSDTKKWFGLLMNAPKNKVNVEGAGQTEVLNLKCPPDLSPFLMENFSAVVPAYHMNKRLWISVVLAGDMPWEEAEKLLELSFDLTKK